MNRLNTLLIVAAVSGMVSAMVAIEPAPPSAPFAVPALARDRHADAVAFLADHGFALLAGVFDDAALVALEDECSRIQQEVARGEHPARHGGEIFIDDESDGSDGTPFVNYVSHITELSPLADAAATHPDVVAVMRLALGDGAWLLDDERFGVVYQDARPGRESAYSRIGWHSDWQSGPHLDMWPSVAFTIHIDATSPANGFLRVVPGSHRRDPSEMPLRFERIPGEIAVYADRGDVILHDAHLWHSAARATEDGPSSVRRHIRGGWYAGRRLAKDHDNSDFVKNAAR